MKIAPGTVEKIQISISHQAYEILLFSLSVT